MAAPQPFDPHTAPGLVKSEPVPGRIATSFPAFASRDFSIFWVGQLISLTGTWIQSVAQQWLVLKLTHSAFALGLVTTVQFTPLLLLALIGGALTDRLRKRELLIVTQIGACILALVLGTLVVTGTVQYWHVLVIAGLLGTVNSFYTPARQAFVPELVAKKELQNAIALNSTLFNGARVVGPAIGGLLIASLGIGLNFYLNAASFVAVIASLLLIKSRPARPRDAETSIMRDVGEGLSYIRATPVVFTILALIGSASLFAMNFTTLLPVIAQDTLGVGSSGFGFLLASMGIGSLAGAISLVFIKQHNVTRQLIYVGIAVFTVTEIAFAFSRSYPVDVALLVIIGLSMNLFTTTANTRIISLTPSKLQGRVMSVYALMFLGMTPFGSLLSGVVAQRWGAPAALACGGAITLAFTIVMFFFRRRQRANAPAG